MEPELFSLARRIYAARKEQAEKEWPTAAPWECWDVPEHPTQYELDPLSDDERRIELAAAIAARPDLAEGLSVPKGHWASGVLPLMSKVVDASSTPVAPLAEHHTIHGKRRADGAIEWTINGKLMIPGERVTVETPTQERERRAAEYEQIIAASPLIQRAIEQRIEDVQHPTGEAGMHSPGCATALREARAALRVAMERWRDCYDAERPSGTHPVEEAYEDEWKRCDAVLGEKCFHGIPMFEDCVACAKGAPR